MQFQFTLQTLLLSAVVIWSSMAAFGAGGLVLAAIILAAVAYIRISRSMWRAAAVVCLAILCGFCVLSFVLYEGRHADEAFRRASCTNNLKEITLALGHYHELHGCFPPAYIADADGKPMHSWRVLILPWLEQRPLYQQYNFDEPWEGPNNRKLAGQRIATYVCPSSKNSTGTSPTTNYVAVVGPKTAWPGPEQTKLGDILDGTHKTIILVEIADSDIHWMEPRDLSFEEALRGINPQSGAGISSEHVADNGYFYHDTAVVNVAFADGTVRTLREGLPLDKIEALLTIDGGETVNLEYCEDYSVPARLNWTKCIALPTLVLSAILLLVRPRRREPQEPQSSDAAPDKPDRQLQSENSEP